MKGLPMSHKWILLGTAGVVALASLSCTSTAPIRTTLSDPSIQYRVPEDHYVVLRRGDIEAVIVDNEPVDDAVLPSHRGGYSGIGSLKHAQRPENLFVPFYAGLNFEHIHDGTNQDRKVLFEPRNWPMQLRMINAHTVELYQSPTPNWKLESCTRYELFADGTIEMTFECIPRAATFRNGYIGLFWASYIHQPESTAIHFLGWGPDDEIRTDQPRWQKTISPAHGVQATHPAADDQRCFPHDDPFNLTLVFNESGHRYAEPWYYGISHGMGWVSLFREKDQIRFAQSPSGGGNGNPAWDFQYFIPDYEVGKCYGFVKRAMYLPFASPERITQATAPHRAALN